MARAFAPQQLGKYMLLRKIATGGMAEVFLARSDGAAGFQKTLVIKKILPNLSEDVQFVEMFLNEARVASQLNHPNVVSIYELGEIDGSYYIAMEFIDGPNLRSISRRALEAGKRIDVHIVCKIIALACEGLQYAHDASGIDGQPLGLIHRDISPDNVLVSRQGAVKVVDFGIAKAANQPHLTKSGMLKGKLSYMPPEQIRGHVLDRRADVFALGVCMYELMAGAKPFDSTSEVAVMQAILHQPPAPIGQVRPDVDAELTAIMEKVLAKDRDQRYESCSAFAADLDGYLMKRQVHITARDLARVVEDLMGPPVPLTTSNPELKALSKSGERASPSAEHLVPKGGTPPPFGTSGSRANSLIASAVDVDVNPTRSDVVSPSKADIALALPARKPMGLFIGLGVAGVAVLAGVGYFATRNGPAPKDEVLTVAVKQADPKPVDPPQPPPAVAANPTATATTGASAPAAGSSAGEVKLSTPPGATTSGAVAQLGGSAVTPPPPTTRPPPTNSHHGGNHTGGKGTKTTKGTEVAVNTPPPAPAPVAAPGKIEFRVLPFAEDVLVDGKHLGPTPLEPFTATPGKHKIILLRQGARYDQEVIVTSGAASVVKHRFDEGP